MEDFIPRIPLELVVPLNMNGLKGRMLRLPSPKNKTGEALLIYGLHSSLERIYGLAQVLGDYTGVSAPDLPGFGGMDSFHRQNEKPNLDKLADYLAAFVKLRYKSKKQFYIVGIGFGFLVATRMMQRYPDIATRVVAAVSLDGFAHRHDLLIKRRKRWFYHLVAKFNAGQLTSMLYKNTILHPSVLRFYYNNKFNKSLEFAGKSKEEKKALIEFEISLWRLNDPRTYMESLVSVFNLDNCKVPVNLKLWHINIPHNKYLSVNTVEQHLRVIFKRVRILKVKTNNNETSLFGDKVNVASLLPKPLLNALSKG